jgi:hypothetical protein
MPYYILEMCNKDNGKTYYLGSYRNYMKACLDYQKIEKKCNKNINIEILKICPTYFINYI